jgi:copper(I)-binding protein
MHFTAQAATVSGINITKAYIRASIPGTSNSSAYMKINNNNEKTVTLVGVTSKISPQIEMHNHLMENGMMHMQQVHKIDIAANSQVILQPHGLHLMFFNLIEPLNHDDTVEVTLHFSDSREITLSLPVKSLK